MNPLSIFVGIVYLVAGLVGMVLNVLCAMLIKKNKELKNSSYFYIVHLCWADAFSSVAIAFYPGVVLLGNLHDPEGAWKSNAAVAWSERIFNLLLQLGWYPSGYFFVLLSLNRLFMLKYSSHEKKVFTKKMLWTTSIIIWVTMGAFTSVNLFYPDLVAFFLEDAYTWNLNHGHWYGRGIAVYNFIHDILCTSVNMTFNGMSLLWVRKTMKQVVSVENAANRKREIKLFIQCLIDSSFYAGTCIGHIFMYFLGECCLNPYIFLVAHIFWISNHVVSPIIYFAYNPKLREMVKNPFASSTTTVSNITNVTVKSGPVANQQTSRSMPRADG